MKSNALAKVLAVYTLNTSSDSAVAWAAVLRILELAKAKPAGEFLRELGSEFSRTESVSSTVRLELNTMRATAVALGKTQFAEILQPLADFLTGSSAETLAAIEERLAKAPPALARTKKSVSADPAVVSGYLKKLETALGDEVGFDELTIELETDSRLGAADYKGLAKSFTGRTVKSKKDALESIRSRQLNLLDARLKQSFNKGQTAA